MWCWLGPLATLGLLVQSAALAGYLWRVRDLESLVREFVELEEGDLDVPTYLRQMDEAVGRAKSLLGMGVGDESP
jgi:hypothetical protein